MPRLAQDVIVVSQPVRTFPNGDFFYVELSRKHNRYDCLLKMARKGIARNPSSSFAPKARRFVKPKQIATGRHSNVVPGSLSALHETWFEIRTGGIRIPFGLFRRPRKA